MFPQLETSAPHRGGAIESFHVYPLFKPPSFTAWDQVPPPYQKQNSIVSRTALPMLNLWQSVEIILTSLMAALPAVVVDDLVPAPRQFPNL